MPVPAGHSMMPKRRLEEEVRQELSYASLDAKSV